MAVTQRSRSLTRRANRATACCFHWMCPHDEHLWLNAFSDLCVPRHTRIPRRTSPRIETHIPSWCWWRVSFAYKAAQTCLILPLPDLSPPCTNVVADCEAEVALNRRSCPDLYLGVCRPWVERDRPLILWGGAGRYPCRTWQLAMRRLPELRDAARSAGARRGPTSVLMSAWPGKLADFHRAAATGQGVGTSSGSQPRCRANGPRTSLRHSSRSSAAASMPQAVTPSNST